MSSFWPPANPAFLGRHALRLAASHLRITGVPLLPGFSGDGPALARALFEAPWVLVSHGVEPDPVLNFGNLQALALWGMSWEQLTRTPSRLTAEAPDREERARLLAQVTARGCIADYAGVRVTAAGRRFRIANAVVWNVADESGQPAGQAARFDHWTFLPDTPPAP